MTKSKYQCEFMFFNELQIGDVFKFSPVDAGLYTNVAALFDMPNIFFTVYQKDENNTKINSTYGKLHKMELANDTEIKVMVFPNKKRIF